jgi:hypothetical protein
VVFDSLRVLSPTISHNADLVCLHERDSQPKSKQPLISQLRCTSSNSRLSATHAHSLGVTIEFTAILSGSQCCAAINNHQGSQHEARIDVERKYTRLIHAGKQVHRSSHTLGPEKESGNERRVSTLDVGSSSDANICIRNTLMLKIYQSMAA